MSSSVTIDGNQTISLFVLLRKNEEVLDSSCRRLLRTIEQNLQQELSIEELERIEQEIHEASGDSHLRS
ncbi:MAG: hypothetical protein ACLFNQ_02695 [Spirochaetaceae bacterium]